jgi:hypothetical protein
MVGESLPESTITTFLDSILIYGIKGKNEAIFGIILPPISYQGAL